MSDAWAHLTVDSRERLVIDGVPRTGTIVSSDMFAAIDANHTGITVNAPISRIRLYDQITTENYSTVTPTSNLERISDGMYIDKFTIASDPEYRASVLVSPGLIYEPDSIEYASSSRNPSAIDVLESYHTTEDASKWRVVPESSVLSTGDGGTLTGEFTYSAPGYVTADQDTRLLVWDGVTWEHVVYLKRNAQTRIPRMHTHFQYSHSIHPDNRKQPDTIIPTVNNAKHLVVDSRGYPWVLTSDGGVQEIGKRVWSAGDSSTRIYASVSGRIMIAQGQSYMFMDTRTVHHTETGEKVSGFYGEKPFVHIAADSMDNAFHAKYSDTLIATTTNGETYFDGEQITHDDAPSIAIAVGGKYILVGRKVSWFSGGDSTPVYTLHESDECVACDVWGEQCIVLTKMCILFVDGGNVRAFKLPGFTNLAVRSNRVYLLREGGDVHVKGLPLQRFGTARKQPYVELSDATAKTGSHSLYNPAGYAVDNLGITGMNTVTAWVRMNPASKETLVKPSMNLVDVDGVLDETVFHSEKSTPSTISTNDHVAFEWSRNMTPYDTKNGARTLSGCFHIHKATNHEFINLEWHGIEDNIDSSTRLHNATVVNVGDILEDNTAFSIKFKTTLSTSHVMLMDSVAISVPNYLINKPVTLVFVVVDGTSIKLRLYDEVTGLLWDVFQQTISSHISTVTFPEPIDIEVYAKDVPYIRKHGTTSVGFTFNRTRLYIRHQPYPPTKRMRLDGKFLNLHVYDTSGSEVNITASTYDSYTDVNFPYEFVVGRVTFEITSHVGVSLFYKNHGYIQVAACNPRLDDTMHEIILGYNSTIGIPPNISDVRFSMSLGDSFGYKMYGAEFDRLADVACALPLSGGGLYMGALRVNGLHDLDMVQMITLVVKSVNNVSSSYAYLSTIVIRDKVTNTPLNYTSTTNDSLQDSSTWTRVSLGSRIVIKLPYPIPLKDLSINIHHHNAYTAKYHPSMVEVFTNVSGIVYSWDPAKPWSFTYTSDADTRVRSISIDEGLDPWEPKLEWITRTSDMHVGLRRTRNQHQEMQWTTEHGYTAGDAVHANRSAWDFKHFVRGDPSHVPLAYSPVPTSHLRGYTDDIQMFRESIAPGDTARITSGSFEGFRGGKGRAVEGLVEIVPRPEGDHSMTMMFNSSKVDGNMLVFPNNQVLNQFNDDTWHMVGVRVIGESVEVFIDGQSYSVFVENEDFTHYRTDFRGTVDDVKTYINVLGRVDMFSIHANRTNNSDFEVRQQGNLRYNGVSNLNSTLGIRFEDKLDAGFSQTAIQVQVPTEMNSPQGFTFHLKFQRHSDGVLVNLPSVVTLEGNVLALGNARLTIEDGVNDVLISCRGTDVSLTSPHGDVVGNVATAMSFDTEWINISGTTNDGLVTPGAEVDIHELSIYSFMSKRDKNFFFRRNDTLPSKTSDGVILSDPSMSNAYTVPGVSKLRVHLKPISTWNPNIPIANVVVNIWDWTGFV